MQQELSPLRDDLREHHTPFGWLAFALLLLGGQALAVGAIVVDLAGRLLG